MLAHSSRQILAVPVEALGFQKELIVVNDGSRDNTGEIAREWARRFRQVRCFTQVPNQGKGKAVQRGIREATGDYILIQDADLEYEPRDYLKASQGTGLCRRGVWQPHAWPESASSYFPGSIPAARSRPLVRRRAADTVDCAALSALDHRYAYEPTSSIRPQ